MADEMYNYFDMLIAESPEPTAVSERRRELASELKAISEQLIRCLLYTSPSPRDLSTSRMPSSA